MVNPLYGYETAPISRLILQTGPCRKSEVPSPFHDRVLDLMCLSLDAP
jgi:hypothetical protein